MSKWKCETCNGEAIEQITSGQRVSDVVSVSVDGGLVCSVKSFIAQQDEYAEFYRCKNCNAILPFEDTKALVNFLQGAKNGKVQV